MTAYGRKAGQDSKIKVDQNKVTSSGEGEGGLI